MPMTPFIGRADFVAHVGQELRLGQGGFLELLVEGDQGGVALDELLLAFPQRPVGGVALQQVQERLANDTGCGQ